MILIQDRPLAAAAAAKLAEYQAHVNDAPAYPDQVAQARKQFALRNKKGNPTFDEVKDTLDAMCAGARRCMYCEDSAADEVEHFRPKDLYPSLVFAWANYLYACGPCNGPKNNKFQVFDPAGAAVDVARKRGAPIVPPLEGDPVLIDPRKEDPLGLLFLDVRDTFEYRPALQLDPRNATRAEYTVNTLGLNREVLRRARRGAFRHYAALLRRYVEGKSAGATPSDMLTWEIAIRRETGHPTVWQEMKRQRDVLTDGIAKLFAAAPETLSW